MLHLLGVDVRVTEFSWPIVAAAIVATAVPSLATGLAGATLHPIQGTTQTVYNTFYAPIAATDISAIREAMIACKLVEFNAAKNRLLRLSRQVGRGDGQPGGLGGLGDILFANSEQNEHDQQVLRQLADSHQFPANCSRQASVTPSFKGAFSLVNVGNEFGIGTAVNGGEGYVTVSPDLIMRYGLGIEAEVGLPGISFFGGTAELFAGFEFAVGNTTSSGNAEVGVNGVTMVGLTLLYEDGGLGTGVGTSTSGYQLIGNTSLGNSWTITEAGIREEFDAPNFEGVQIDVGAALAIETLRQFGMGAAQIVLGTTTIADQTLDGYTRDTYVGPRLSGGVSWTLGNADLRIGAYGSLYYHYGQGEITQTTNFAGITNQQLNYADGGFAFSAGLEFGAAIDLNQNIELTLDGELSALSGVTTMWVPDSPLMQPGGFERTTMTRAFLSVGLRYNF